MQPREIEIKPENGAIAIRVINTVTPNAWEYYQFAAIKSVVPVSVLGMGTRQADNNRKNPMRYDNKLQFVINFHDENESAPIKYNIAAVSNQVTWTNDFAGLLIAVSDINSWMVTGSSGLATEATSAAILAEVVPATVSHTPIITSGSGSVSAGTLRGSVLNLGPAAGTWNGISLPAGVTMPWEAVGNRDTYGLMAYDATGTTFVIEYTT